MFQLILIYWIIAGLAAFRLDADKGVALPLRFIASMAFGGIAIPVSILRRPRCDCRRAGSVK